MRTLTVCVEWPTGSEEIEVEIEDDLTGEEVRQIAEDVFFNTCNYGYSIDGEPQ